MTEQYYPKLNIGVLVKLIANYYEKLTNYGLNLNYTEIFKNNNSSDKCVKQFDFFLRQVNESKGWALNMLDSWGKPPTGFFYGNMFDYGNIDQCLKISQHFSDEADTINGQWCLSFLRYGDSSSIEKAETINASTMDILNKYVSFGFGMCIPASCTQDMVDSISANLLSDQGTHVTLYNPRMFNEITCFRNESMEFTTIDYFAILFFSIITVLMVFSSIYDLYTKYKKVNPNPILISYSIPSNLKKVFSINNEKISSDFLPCLDGIRVLSIVLVMISHLFAFRWGGIVINRYNIMEWISNYTSIIIISGRLAVDSFLVLSGILTTWKMFKILDKGKSLNLPTIYFFRYVRISVGFFALILFGITLLRYVGDGPLHNSLYYHQFRPCTNFFWSTVLHIQNYVNPDKMCVIHSWYLSVDFQLFLLSPLIIIPLWKWKKKFIVFIFILIACLCLCRFSTLYVNKGWVNIFQYGIKDGTKNIATYFVTHLRMVSWLIGILLGYTLYTTKDENREISKKWLLIGWSFAFAFIAVAIFGQYDMQQIDYRQNLFNDAIYSAIATPCWCFFLSWIIFVCAKGYGGYVNDFLSHKFWQPLARLTFMIYLIHFIYQSYDSFNLKSRAYFSSFELIYTLFSELGGIFLISLIWYLAFEAPVLAFQGLLLKKAKQ